MRSTQGSSADRLAELDRQYLKPNVAIAAAIALLSVLLFHDDNWALVFWSSAPLISAIVGFAFLRRALGISRWTVLHLGIASIAVTATTQLTGGAASPLFLWIPAIGLLWVTHFPETAWSLIVAPLSSAAVIGLDWSATGQATETVTVTNALLISVLIPVFALRLVANELHHRQQAVIDHLTGCLNRHALATRSVELQQQIDLTGEPVGVVTFDIDHFKKINDLHGHNVGDSTLQDLSYAVRKNLRRFELFYRLGGEEFLVLLAGADEAQTFAMAERIRETAASIDVQGRQISVSCGIAVAKADTSLDDAMQQADTAMYQAKRAGRNRSVIHGRLPSAARAESTDVA